MNQKQHVIVFGASGGTGKQFVKQALEAGYSVTAFVRNPAKLDGLTHDHLKITVGDATDVQAVAEAIAGHDVVVSCLGGKGLGKSTVLTTMTDAIVQGMKQHGLDRILYVASAGVHKEVPGFFGSLVQFMLRNVLVDHQGAIERMKDAGLSYTIARPLQLTDGPFTGVYRTAEQGVPRGGSRISRADVAHFLLERLKEEGTKSESVGLAY